MNIVMKKILCIILALSMIAATALVISGCGDDKSKSSSKTDATKAPTSAATVAILPEAEEVDVEIREADIHMDTYRSSGAGGQYINKTDSAVRLTHIPTGVVVSCQTERSQLQNRLHAMEMLRSKILDALIAKKEQEEAANRKALVGTGDRSAKIRTYNYPQNRVTDHRIGLTLYNLDKVVTGELDEIINGLQMANAQEKLGKFNA